ncbi:MAG: glutamate racemase [Verrucomicrobia bacterium]|nr:MAG: glutamate racemase [Verrucomicrobiota bacterium]
MSDSRLIGVFDSGIGGLTVVKALRDLLPNEKIFYVGDTARVPYGGKSASTVERYSLEIADILIEENAKILVVACNTASSVALRKLEEHLPVPVTGVIRPGARAAVAATRNHHIGVIGTRATIKSGAYERELRALNPGVHISVRACPLLVPLIEEAWLDDELTDRVIGRYLEPLVMEGIDTLVLGCTHYPLLIDAFSRALGERVKLVDSARNCATAVQELLDRQQLRAPSGTPGGLEIALTDTPDNFLRVAREALQLEIGEIQLREVLHGASML